MAPLDGDIVVTRAPHPEVHYTVRQLPGIVQFSASDRDAAFRLARSFAQTHAVDVWYSEDGAYRLLDGFRRRNEDQAV